MANGDMKSQILNVKVIKLSVLLSVVQHPTNLVSFPSNGRKPGITIVFETRMAPGVQQQWMLLGIILGVRASGVIVVLGVQCHMVSLG